jgi:hypothetical protein
MNPTVWRVVAVEPSVRVIYRRQAKKSKINLSGVSLSRSGDNSERPGLRNAKFGLCTEAAPGFRFTQSGLH